jgi:hypothetical protein
MGEDTNDSESVSGFFEIEDTPEEIPLTDYSGPEEPCYEAATYPLGEDCEPDSQESGPRARKSILIRRDHEDEDIQAYLRKNVYMHVWRRLMTVGFGDKRVQWWDSPPRPKADPVQHSRVHEPMDEGRARDRSSPEGLRGNGTGFLQETPEDPTGRSGSSLWTCPIRPTLYLGNRRQVLHELRPNTLLVHRTAPA